MFFQPLQVAFKISFVGWVLALEVITVAAYSALVALEVGLITEDVIAERNLPWSCQGELRQISGGYAGPHV